MGFQPVFFGVWGSKGFPNQEFQQTRSTALKAMAVYCNWTPKCHQWWHLSRTLGLLSPLLLLGFWASHNKLEKLVIATLAQEHGEPELPQLLAERIRQFKDCPDCGVLPSSGLQLPCFGIVGHRPAGGVAQDILNLGLPPALCL